MVENVYHTAVWKHTICDISCFRSARPIIASKTYNSSTKQHPSAHFLEFALSLGSQLLRVDAGRRSSAREATEHPWVGEPGLAQTTRTSAEAVVQQRRREAREETVERVKYVLRSLLLLQQA